MSRWFRFYAEAIRNPKVMRLSDKDFRLWVRLMAVASEAEGKIPPLDDLRHVLSMRLDHLSSGVDRLISGGLIDALADGYEPHNWAKFQYKSDTSTERVTRHRAKRNVSETPPDTEAETDTEKKEERDGDASVASGRYAFKGSTVRLTHHDLGAWRKTYHAIPDIVAELTSLDAWFETNPDKRKTWFQVTSGALNRKHQERLGAASDRVLEGAASGPVC